MIDPNLAAAVERMAAHAEALCDSHRDLREQLAAKDRILESLAARVAAQSELLSQRAARGQNDRLESVLLSLCGYALTANCEASPVEWLQGLVDRVNEAAVTLGEADRFGVERGKIVRLP